MGVESKALFLKTLEGRLRTTMSVDMLDHTLSIVSGVFDEYDITITSSVSDRDDMLDTFVSALNIMGRSEKTIARYKYVLGRMYDRLNIPTRDITVYHLRNYLVEEKKRGICDSTLEGCREIFSSYFNWLSRESLIPTNPVANLGVIKCPKIERKAYTEVDIERLKSNAKSLRDKAIVCFLLATACRINEMIQLNRDDVDLVKTECQVLGKGNKQRTVYLDSVSVMAISDYLESRTDSNEALFVSSSKVNCHRLTPGGVRLMLHNLGSESGVDNVHPHRFRRTKATSLIKHGMPIQEVATILGHEQIDTTMKYVDLDKNDVKNSYRRYT